MFTSLFNRLLLQNTKPPELGGNDWHFDWHHSWWVLQDTRFKVVLTTVQVFWDVMPHSKINSYRHFGAI